MGIVSFNPRPRTAGDDIGSKRCQSSYLEHRFREPNRLNVLAEDTLRIRRC